MFEDIIDIKEESTKSVFYSKITFICGVFSLILLAIIGFYIWLTKGQFVYAFVHSGFVLMFCSTAVGLVAGLISFRFKETSAFFKWSGTFINICVLIALVYLTISV